MFLVLLVVAIISISTTKNKSTLCFYGPSKTDPFRWGGIQAANLGQPLCAFSTSFTLGFPPEVQHDASRCNIKTTSDAPWACFAYSLVRGLHFAAVTPKIHVDSRHLAGLIAAWRMSWRSSVITLVPTWEELLLKEGRNAMWGIPHHHRFNTHHP
jgi:hypothetical protein